MSYVSFGADVPFRIKESYGLDKESAVLPEKSTNAHIRIFVEDDGKYLIHLDIEGVSLAFITFPEGFSEGSRFIGQLTLSKENLQKILKREEMAAWNFKRKKTAKIA